MVPIHHNNQQNNIKIKCQKTEGTACIIFGTGLIIWGIAMWISEFYHRNNNIGYPFIILNVGIWLVIICLYKRYINANPVRRSQKKRNIDCLLITPIVGIFMLSTVLLCISSYNVHESPFYNAPEQINTVNNTHSAIGITEETLICINSENVEYRHLCELWTEITILFNYSYNNYSWSISVLYQPFQQKNNQSASCQLSQQQNLISCNTSESIYVVLSYDKINYQLDFTNKSSDIVYMNEEVIVDVVQLSALPLTTSKKAMLILIIALSCFACGICCCISAVISKTLCHQFYARLTNGDIIDHVELREIADSEFEHV